MKRVKAYSDKNVYIERDGAPYSEADDFVYQNRKYAETDELIEDYIEYLESLGFNVDKYKEVTV